MISVGSWGDVDPYIALAQELLRRKHSVDLFVQSQYQDRIDSILHDNNDSSQNYFHVHPLPFNQQDFYKVKKKNSSVDPRLKHVETVGEIMGELVLPCVDILHSVILRNHKCRQVIISSALARPLSILLAKSTKLKMILLHLQPLAPNQLFPLYRISIDKCVQAILLLQQQQSDTTNSNLLLHESSYWEIDQPLEEIFLKERLEKAYQTLDLLPPTWSELQKLLRGFDSRFTIVNAFSNHLIPPIRNTPGVGPHVYDIGPLAHDFLPSNFVPDPSLVDFLKRCQTNSNSTPPICIGFGSMPFHQFNHVLMDALMELVQQEDSTTTNFVLVGAQLQSCPQQYHDFIFGSNRIHRVKYVPYSFLLPQCSMMICHGGAGVVHTCLHHAGIPCLVCPIMGDQFLFASLLEQKGLGLQIKQFANKDELVNAIQKMIMTATSSTTRKENCQRIRLQEAKKKQQQQQERGVTRMVNLLETIVSSE